MKIKNATHIRELLLQWYHKQHRKLPWRDTQNPYHIWISEVMLQQTQVKTVLSYYRKFLRRFPTLKHLARSDLQPVLKVWEGLGYYARARNLHRAANIVMERHDGVIPKNMKEFRKLPGVGEYIASAVLSIAFDLPHSVVDGNVKRFIARFLRVDEPVNHSAAYKTYRNIAEQFLDRDCPGLFNQVMMELGALVCRPKNPLCDLCPVRPFCLAYSSKTVHAYPKRLQPKPVPTLYRVAGIIFKNGRVLITQRKTDGLLGGLWEFPGGEIGADETADAACVREIKKKVNLSVQVDQYLTRVNHAYTHFKIVMDVFCCQMISGKVKLNGVVDYRWITLDEIDNFPFPKANHKFIPLLKAQWSKNGVI
jgi:A/G-specific adenine glycosylase